MTEVGLQGVYDAINLGDMRRPEYHILLFDQLDTFSDIVLGNHTQIPRDLTSCIENCSISESEDAGSTAEITIVPDYTQDDPLTPYHFTGRRIIQILFKDAREESFSSIFIGPTVGQPGYRRNRETNEKTITVSCVDRSFFYNKRKCNSPSFPEGSDLGDIAVDIATNGVYGMGLEREEVKFGLFRHEVEHTTVTQFDIPYMEALKNLSFISDLAPAWDGGGFLVMLDTSLDKPPVRKYEDESIFLNIEWPKSNVDINNTVVIIGLNSDISKVVAPFQELLTHTGTIGYFESEYKKRLYYSEDQQGRVQGVVISNYNLNGQLSSILGGDPTIKEINDFSCVLVIKTPYQAWLFIIFFYVYISFFVVAAYFGGTVSSVLQAAAAVWLVAGLMLMQQMGTFEVTISGEPYKLVLKEIKGEASWSNLNDYEVRPKTIENHLVDTQALANSIAKRELKRETVKGSPRSLSLPYDPFLRKTDVIELPDGSRYYIKSISKTLKRGEPQDMSISALMIRSGKEYNNIPGFSEY